MTRILARRDRRDSVGGQVCVRPALLLSGFAPHAARAIAAAAFASGAASVSECARRYLQVSLSLSASRPSAIPSFVILEQPPLRSEEQNARQQSTHSPFPSAPAPPPAGHIVRARAHVRITRACGPRPPVHVPLRPARFE